MICALCNVFTQKGLTPVKHLVPSAFLVSHPALVLTGEDQETEGHIYGAPDSAGGVNCAQAACVPSALCAGNRAAARCTMPKSSGPRCLVG